MAQNAPANYVPQYASQDEWEDKQLQQFAIDFYRISDNPEENQRWVDSFTEDANVQIGADKARGSKDLAEFRSRMWKHIKERKHTVLKVFPGRFSDSNECMILGDVSVTTTDGRLKESAWSAHAVVSKVEGQWKFSQYRVWLQTEGHLL
ncbi:putative Fungal specific transcription factor [Fusarium austroafricanum]|uniref:Putative Fungal specific transcription factor n=1 Tax=Fusarium austroafricanum TaxID=2364996 RepID=A0A8H4KGE9_9HYPO|nr:putative Fungal specific transcription factor [Fusarium austroafricanum]